MLSQPGGFLNVSLAESRASAAFPSASKGHFITGRFEDLDCGNSDVRFMVTNERVVPKYDPASITPFSGAMSEPMIESLPRVVRQRALPGDAKSFRQGATNEQRIESQVGQAWHSATDFPQKIQGAEEPLAQGKTIPLDARVEKLGFEESHVYVRRTLRRASLAGKTITQGGLHFLALQLVTISETSSFKRRPNRIGSPPRGHDLVARDEERWTHGRDFFATPAAAVALLEIASKGAIAGRKGEGRRERQLQLVTGAQAQVGIDFEFSIRNDFAGIENIVGIEN